MLVTTKEMFEKARRDNYAILAPDFYDSNSCRVYVETCEKLNIPTVLSFAEAHSEMISVEEAALLGKFYGERAKVDVALHLDHGQHLDTIKKAIDLGFTSVMIDASFCDFDENVKRTKEVVQLAHARNVVVEAEIGHVGQAADEGTTEGQGLDHSIYTEVSDAVKFVELTGVDSLAVSIGTAHGMYKGTPVINFDRLHELRKAVPVPLVLHGGSSSGDENLGRCATEGITKINVFTDFITATLNDIKKNDYKNWFEAQHGMDKAIAEVYEHYAHVFNLVK